MTLAADVNFQVYLLGGIHRWNQNREREAVQATSTKEPLSYNGTFCHSMNKLAQERLDWDICSIFTTTKIHRYEFTTHKHMILQ